jgi:hypothetical protein
MEHTIGSASIAAGSNENVSISNSRVVIQQPETCTGSDKGETHEAEWDVRAGFQRACS